MQFTYHVFESDNEFFVSIALADVPAWVIRHAQTDLEKLGEFIEDDAELIVYVDDTHDVSTIVDVVRHTIERHAMVYRDLKTMVDAGTFTMHF